MRTSASSEASISSSSGVRVAVASVGMTADSNVSSSSAKSTWAGSCFRRRYSLMKVFFRILNSHALRLVPGENDA